MCVLTCVVAVKGMIYSRWVRKRHIHTCKFKEWVRLVPYICHRLEKKKQLIILNAENEF